MYFSGLDAPVHYLTGFYSFASGYMQGVNAVISIKENGISILATVLLVAIILFGIYNFYNKP